VLDAAIKENIGVGLFKKKDTLDFIKGSRR